MAPSPLDEGEGPFPPSHYLSLHGSLVSTESPPLAQPSNPSAAVHAFGSREYSGSGTALLMGAILLLPSHCPKDH
ncbi:hypothetical protein N7516_001917 [Penicillium verrucosum]|uniref:uncharacterized protein n=1 Tax=Penicillium verrucosum TaxID=60171 RepID=UPI0025450327|nr:uncharacterized protein N7516_001917 [Penicillium verrucosum]KAJ5941749.1 hypothetical protein N7516_001917 [Penicillium verrucosum]